MRVVSAVCTLLVAASLIAVAQSTSTRIAGVNEPPELTGEPKKVKPVSEALRQLSAIMEKWKEDDPGTVKALRPQLDAFVTAHPGLADGYALRAVADACYLKKNYESASRDIHDALIASESKQRMFTSADLYAFRARIDYETGHHSEALDDLEKAMNQRLDSADSIFNSGGTKPDANSGRCAWDLSDFNSLVQKFPRDYRTIMFRALYLSFFSTFDEKYLQQAIQEFQKAVALNPRTPLPHYFIGHLYVKSAFWSKAAWTSDAVRDEAHRKAIIAFTRAINLDATFLDAFVQRANAYLQLKQSRQAVTDYDAVLRLDPENGSAYHDRALAKVDLGEYYSGISDFGESIQRQTPDDGAQFSTLYASMAYENRADAYMKVGKYTNAVSDFDKAIAWKLANDSFLMSLTEFRVIYPEYEAVTDDAFVKKLQARFWPEFTYDVLAKQLSGNKDFKSTQLADLYVKRGDAYLKAGNFRKASAEYNRAFLGFGEYGKATERWRQVGSGAGGDFYVDVKTMEFASSGYARLWLKTLTKKATYSVDASEIDCKERRLHEVSEVEYDSKDNVLRRTNKVGGWESIIPDSIGETLFEGMCKTGSRP